MLVFQHLFDASPIRNVRVTVLTQPCGRWCVVPYMVAHCLAALLYLGVFQGELAHDPIVRAALWDLLADARYGLAETEEAMFVVRNDDGTLSFVRWSSMHMLHEAQWSAPLPRGVIAIVHTHPNRSPRPSLGDIRTALHSNIPIYVVTRTKITKTMGGNTRQVASGDWRLGLTR